MNTVVYIFAGIGATVCLSGLAYVTAFTISAIREYRNELRAWRARINSQKHVDRAFADLVAQYHKE